jgi:hypothetical protein
MAEALAVAHMESVGFGDAEKTPSGSDKGLDVISANAHQYRELPVFYWNRGFRDVCLFPSISAHFGPIPSCLRNMFGILVA